MSGMLTDPATGINYIDPAMPVGAYTTFAVRRKTRPATCFEAECDYWNTGFYTYVDPKMSQGPDRINYIRYGCGRRFSETVRDDGVHVFYFYPHQLCFRQHTLPESDDIYLKRHGDWRGNPSGERHRFAGPADWVDNLQEHTSRLLEANQRG